ncbi:thyroid transcription factor 1-associated protein 26 homolog [Brachionichthys hirsutus]|uniref:thyroid transcription factor 1-associated protein 26 homolog n=1 Tax=Brachionichthys hirsutus TaxID=412623 RepID=UPI003604B9EF
MAPTDQKMKNEKFTKKGGDWRNSKANSQSVFKKRKWIPDNKVYQGGVNEGQGFALKRKQKVKHDYNKLLRKEETTKKKKATPTHESKNLYKEEYPEHLRHLYLAEAEKLKNEAWTNRMNRSKMRMQGRKKEEEAGESEEATQQSDAADAEPGGDAVSERMERFPGNEEPAAAAAEKESLPMSNRMRKKMLKKTSYQKTKEEFEAVREKQRKKKEDYLKTRQQREEAVQKYKQKKMEAFQMLSKKTKRGQPNLNLQMDYLLQKIQGNQKMN